MKYEPDPRVPRFELTLPPMDGAEIAPGIYLMGEPTPIPDSNLMRCLANVGGMLGVVELSIKFKETR